MKASVLIIACAALLAGISSCKKNDDNGSPASSSCTIILNDTLTIKPDSVHWDYYSAGIPRIQAFNGAVATFTIWPTSINSGTTNLMSQYAYWIYKTGTYNVNNNGGTLILSNYNDMLSGSITANGTLWIGTGPTSGKMTATFSNVRKVGS